MFVPSKKIRLMITGHSASYANVYKNGIVVVEQKHIKIAKDQTAPVTLVHVFPCDIQLTGCKRNHENSAWDYDFPIHKIQFNEADFIAYGVAGIRVTLNQATEEMRQKGLTATTINLHTPDGVTLSQTKIHGALGNRFQVYPDYDSDFKTLAPMTWEEEWKGVYNVSLVMHETDGHVSGKN